MDITNGPDKLTEMYETALEENAIYDLREIVRNGLIYKSLTLTLMKRTGKNEYKTKKFISRLVSEGCLVSGGLAYPLEEPKTKEDMPAYQKTREDLTRYELGPRWLEKVQSIVG